jgi:hypothetical protein
MVASSCLCAGMWCVLSAASVTHDGIQEAEQ